VNPSTILITGATGGLGGALAKYYAKPGVHLLLHGRNTELLSGLAAHCRDSGAEVTTLVMDLRDIPALQNKLAEIATHSLPDLVIANAGININQGNNREGESWQAIETLLDVNIKSTLALVNALLPAMRQRGSGQIALISSLAAYYGIPITPSYSASKAAIKNYGEAMRGWLAIDGIRVNVVMPGYVKSDMANAMPGPKPFMLTPEKAAQIIAKGLEKNRARISFPFPINIGTWFLAVFPAGLSQWLVRRFGYGG
jgi:short-subunit dehydrogenase